MNKIDFSLVFLLLLSTITYAQIVEPATNIDKHTLQIEIEAQYAQQKEGTEKQISWSIPSVLFRYGLLNGLELQLNAPLIKEELYENDHLIHSLNKFDHIQFGVSVNLWKQKNLLPEAAFMARVIIPFKQNLNYNAIGKIAALNFSNLIGEKFSLNYNIGYVTETESEDSAYYIANITYNLNSKMHFFAENFADFSQNLKAFQNINIGGGYQLNEQMCIDLSIANGLNHSLFYTGMIFTWQLNTKKK